MGVSRSINMEIYLDNAATAKVYPEVAKRVNDVFLKGLGFRV